MQKRRFLITAGSVATLGMASTATWAQGSETTPLGASQVRLAAASDLKLVLPGIATAFERETGFKVTVTYGASGNLARQLAQGLPMDLFMSADEALVARLLQAGWARDAGVVYAQGRLALIVPKATSSRSALSLDADLLGLQAFKAVAGAHSKFAIANPDHAPYGRAAKSALEKTGLWQTMQPHLVLGESVSQATQFVSTGAASAGLVALSLAAAPELAGGMRHIAVNPALHPPIIQRMALHVNAGAAAQRLYAYLQTPTVKTIFKGHGLG